MERTVWTDERLDDLATTLDRSFNLLREEMVDVRHEIRSLRDDLSTWQRQIAQIGWALATALATALVAAVVAVLVAVL